MCTEVKGAMSNEVISTLKVRREILFARKFYVHVKFFFLINTNALEFRLCVKKLEHSNVKMFFVASDT